MDADEVGHHCECRLKHGRCDALAAPGASSMEKRTENSNGEKHTGCKVHNLNLNLRRFLTPRCCDIHEASERLNIEFKTGPISVWPRFAKCGQRCVDDVGIDSRRITISQAESLHYARPKVLYQHVTLCNHLAHNARRLGVLQVDDHGSLVAIDREKIGALTALKRGTHQSHHVALGGLDFDHVSPKIPEQARSKRSR